MRSLTDREKRTVRLATVGMAIYLVLFFGVRLWRHAEARRAAYQDLVAQAERLQYDFELYETKVLQAEKLKGTFRIDLAGLSKSNLVADASAAIQQTAKSGGLQLGPVRESAARSSSRELTSMQIEGVGPVPAVIGFLHRLETVGYPLIIESVQLSPQTGKPGTLKLSLTITIVDFEQWKKKGAA